MACKNKEQLYLKANWSGGNPESRKAVLLQLLEFISPKKIMDSRRLEVLIGQALQFQISQCKYHNSAHTEMSLMQDHQCKNNQIPSVCVKTLALHTDEVWSVYFAPSGKFFASVSRDNVVIIWSIQKNEADNKVEVHAVSKVCSKCLRSGKSRHTTDKFMASRGVLCLNILPLYLETTPSKCGVWTQENAATHMISTRMQCML